MRKNLNRFLGITMAAAMVMGSLAGCGKTTEPTAASEPAAASTAAATTDETAAASQTVSAEGAGMESWQPFAEKVSITVPVYDRSKEGYPAVDNNYWTQWIQSEFGDKYNVEVKFLAIPRGDVMTKYSMLIAAGDTPTILMEYDYPNVAQWANDGAMATIDLEAFKQVAPTYYQSMVDNNQLQYTALNGDDYFVLSERPYYNTTYTFGTFVRMDWLREVGYDHVPKNYEEEQDAIAKIIDAGLAGQAPVGLTLPNTAYVTNFAYRDFPVDEKEWAQHSTLSTPSLSWEPTKKYIKRLNAEYNAGWYSSEFDLDVGTAGTTTTQWQTDFINGNSYRYGGYMSANVDWLAAFYENNPDAELAIESNYHVVEPGVVEQPALRADNPFGMIVGFSALATEDQLKAAWMYMEWMSQEDVLFTMENGVEGITYTLDADGLPVMIDCEGKGIEEMLNHNNNIDMTCIVHASKTIGDIEDSIKAISPQNLPQDFTQNLIDMYYEQKEIADKGWAYSDPVFAVPVDSESEYATSLLSVYQEAFSKLVKCKPEEFDALYDTMSQEFLDAGYQEVIDERLAAYEAGNCTKLPEGAGK